MMQQQQQQQPPQLQQLQQLQQQPPPPPYSRRDSHLLDLPSVPVDAFPAPRNGVAPLLPALEPSPSINMSTASRNPLDSAIHDQLGHFSPKYHTGTMLQPLRLPSVPQTLPGETSRELPSPVRASSAMSLDRPVYTQQQQQQQQQRREASITIEDPNDRMAAEALCGLGKADSISLPTDPSGYDTPLQYYPIGIEHRRSGSHTEEPEPLLSLLTSSHPWLGGTINGSLNAYSSTKQHTPRFIQYGADLVETTVGSVGRKTGVEDSIRRYLAPPRRPSELDPTNAANLREANDAEMTDATRVTSNASVDSLPAYDNNRSPEYVESKDPLQTGGAALARQFRPPTNRSWSTQLMISTSGLGAALSEGSLRSLKYCLSILSSANNHVRNLMEALKSLLQDYDGTARNLEAGTNAPTDTSNAMQVDGANPTAEHPSVVIAQRIRHLNDEIWQTLKSVVNTISSYTGGALPENASVVVRWQLMSVPRRWQRAVSAASQPPSQQSDDAVGSANRMLAFAIEGLDMMDQVGGVVDSTISSAERWLDSMGRRCRNAEPVPSHPQMGREEKMLQLA